MSEINEKTRVSLAINSWWGVLVVVCVVMGCYFGLQAKTDKAMEMSQATAIKQEEMQKNVNQMQSDIRSVAQDVSWFRRQYELDMNRFIREQPEKPGRR